MSRKTARIITDRVSIYPQDMFSKQVWHDRKHQVEVFITEEGVISGTIIAYKGGVCLINPRPEVLIALYQEAKIKRILGVNAVLLTDNTPAFTRGLCALVSYSRGLRRRRPLSVVTRSDTKISTDFLNSCCARLLEDSAFDVDITTLKRGETLSQGEGRVRYIGLPGIEANTANPYLEVVTRTKTIQYYDESHTGQFDDTHVVNSVNPDLVIRATELPRYSQVVRERVLKAI